jgi:hypothetical protein
METLHLEVDLVGEISGSHMMSMKMAVLWDVALCSLAISLMLEAVGTSETWLSFY